MPVVVRRKAEKRSPPVEDYRTSIRISKTRMSLPVLQAKESKMEQAAESSGTPPVQITEDPPLVSDLGTKSLDPLLESVREDGNLPLNEMFKHLTGMLKKKMPKIRNTDIAALIGIRPQSCSQYKTGSDGRKPPWSIILQMMVMMNLELVINADGWRFRKRRKKRVK
jgi:hypothetical protein